MSGMFEDCSVLTTLNLSSFNTANVTDMSDMFMGCYNLTTITAGSDFVTTQVTSSSSMFASCNNLRGDMGTTYNSQYKDKTYARIDGGTAAPGYFSPMKVSFDKTSLQTALGNISGNYTLTFAYSAPAGATRGAALNSDNTICLYSNGSDYTVAPATSGAVIMAPANCYQMFYNYTRLTSLTFTNFNMANVTNMSQMFRGCTSLQSITLPSSVTSIGELAFYQCTGLTSITIPTSVTSIGENAFLGCTGLTGTLTIPSSVTSIGNNAFNECTGLTGTLTIPEGVTSIGESAFNECTGLTSITIPSSVTTLGNYAFYQCSGLTGTLTIPSSVTSIGQSAFYGCTGLTSAAIYSSCTPGWGLFFGCTKLASVTFGSSVGTIGSNALRACTGLKTMKVLCATPPTVMPDAFYQIPTTCTVQVLCSKVSDYQSASGWSRFTNYVPMHDWDEGVWQWAEDGSDATLTLTCQNDANHTQIFTKANGVTITSSETVAATCETAGERTCTAACTYDNKEYSPVPLVVAVPATGHNYVNGVCTVCGHVKEMPGKGTAENPYQISFAAQLFQFVDSVNDGKTGLCAQLMADIDISQTQNTMITTHYAGTFDGNGHTLTVSFDRTADDAAFFQRLYGTVKKLTVAGTITTSKKFAAGIAAHSYSGATISQCVSEVNIVNNISGDGTHAGFVAVAEGATTIEDCAFKGSITGSGTNSCGGIVGWAGASGTIIRNTLMTGTMSVGTYNSNTISPNPDNVTFTNCYYTTAINETPSSATQVTADQLASGEVACALQAGRSTAVWGQNVTTTARDFRSYSYAGGIVGYNSSSNGYCNRIDSCANTGNVTARGGRVGGIVGEANAMYLDSLYNSGRVLSTDTGEYAGGIVGIAANYNNRWPNYIRHCINIGDSVRANGLKVGGIVGENHGDMKDCHNRAHVTTTARDFRSYSYAGGVVGYFPGYNNGTYLNIDSCSNTGNVTAGGGKTGGIAGDAFAYELSHLYNSGRVLSTGTGDYVGGIVGFHENGGRWPNSLYRCVNDGSEVQANGQNVGGIAGLNFGDVRHCYNHADVTTTARDNSNYSYVGGIVGNNRAYSNKANLIDSCSNTGNITAAGGYAGGIVGYGYTAMDSLYNSGDIVSAVGNFVGGIAGISMYNVRSSYIYRSINEGSVSANGQYIGGIAGENQGDIRDCCNRGNVVSTQTDPYMYVGGIVGYNYYYDSETYLISSCTNSGNVTSPGGYSGGIAGCCYANLHRCANTGDITVNASGLWVGGLAGCASVLSGRSDTISTCYNTGNITLTAGEQVGGLVGYLGGASPKVTNVYSTGALNLGSSVTYAAGALIGRTDISTWSESAHFDLYLLSTETLPAVGNFNNGSEADKVLIHTHTPAEFANGVVEYQLNYQQLTGNWGQNLGTDASPVLDDKGVRYTRQMANEWGTLVLPFEVDYDTTNEDYKLYYLSSASVNGNAGSLVFTEYTDGTIPAGTPMVVKAVGSRNDDGKYVISIDANSACSLTITPTTPVNGFSMDGTYEQLTGKTGIYFIANNQFWWAESAITIAPYRAWFNYSGTSAPTRFDIVEGTEGEQTATGLEDWIGSNGSAGANGSNDDTVAEKFFHDGKFYILRGGKVYDATGRLVTMFNR